MQSGPSNGNNGKGRQQSWADQIRNKKYYIIVSLALLIVFLGGAWYGSHRGGQPASAGSRRILYYVDPMNPTHTSPEPGISSCGMKLEPVYAEGDQGELPPPLLPPGSIKITPQKQQLIGVRQGVVEKAPYRHTLRTLGRVAIDESRIYRVNAFMGGWIQNTLNNATGSLVMKDEILVSYRSPEILPMVQMYLESLSNLDKTPKKAQGGQLISLMYKAENALKNIGVSNAQIAEMAQTRRAKQDIDVRAPVTSFVLVRNVSPGQRISPGDELYKLADLSHVWIAADLYEKEASFIKPGLKVQVTLPHRNQTVEATVSDIRPDFDKVSRTFRVRLETDNPDYTLRPEMFVDVEFPVDLPEAVTVPVDAVMNTGLKKTAFVDRGNGYFEPRKVETGWRLGDRMEITKGLDPGERIIISGNFLVDSESRMKLAAAGMFGEVVRDPVTGVDVDESKARAAGHQSRYKNQTYYFHSEESQRQFEQNPERYLENRARSQEAGETGSQEKPGPTVTKCPLCSLTVDENEARAKGLTSEYQGKTYYFCRYYCNRQFDKDPGHYIKEEPSCCGSHGDQAKTEEPLIVKDPVCGLEVNREEAAARCLKREYQGLSSYFCRDYCAQQFDKAPGRFLSGPASQTTLPDLPSMITPDAPWFGGTWKLPVGAAGTQAVEKDPVCGMKIGENMTLTQSPYKTYYRGKPYSFCSYSCKEVFDLDPERYLNKSAVDSTVPEPAAPTKGQPSPPESPGVQSAPPEPSKVQPVPIEPPKAQPEPAAQVPAPANPQQEASLPPLDPYCFICATPMKQDPKKPFPYKSEKEGTTYYFCSPECKAQFDQIPRKLTTPPPPPELRQKEVKPPAPSQEKPAKEKSRYIPSVRMPPGFQKPAPTKKPGSGE